MYKEKPKDHTIQPVGLGKTRICPIISLHKDTKAYQSRKLPPPHTCTHAMEGKPKCFQSLLCQLMNLFS